MIRLAVLLSGGGRSLQNFIDRIAAGTLDAEVVLVIASRDGCGGLERAHRAGIPALVESDTEIIFELLRRHAVDLVCLAGYLKLLAPIPTDFEDRVLNIHPSLLPDFGGAGYYGDRVHRAVLEAGVRESGCTVHICDDAFDRGPILLQRRVAVLPGDSVDSLAQRVFAEECEAYPEAIRLWQAQRG